MGRVHSLRTATAGPTQSRVASRQNANGKKKPSYKVVIEQFTEKKKKLLTTVRSLNHYIKAALTYLHFHLGTGLFHTQRP